MAISSSAFDQVAMLACTEQRCSPNPQVLYGRSFLNRGLHRALMALSRHVMADSAMLASQEAAVGMLSSKAPSLALGTHHRQGHVCQACIQCVKLPLCKELRTGMLPMQAAGRCGHAYIELWMVLLSACLGQAIEVQTTPHAWEHTMRAAREAVLGMRTSGSGQGSSMHMGSK